MKLFQTFSEWLIRLIWTNLLWIFFTVAGLGVFGIMPATVAMFTVTRRWNMKETEFSIWHLFKDTYIKSFKESNLIGLIFLLIGGFLFLDLSFSEQMTGFFSLFLYVLFLFLLLMLFVTILFFFPLYVHYTFSIKEYILQALFHTFASLKDLSIMAIGFVGLTALFVKAPGLLPFLGAVLPSFWIMRVCLNRFKRMEKSEEPKESKAKQSDIEALL